MARKFIILIVAALLLAVAFPASGASGNGQKARFGYGVEWGSLLTIYNWSSNTYTSEEGYLVDETGGLFNYHANGFIAARAGVDFRKLNLSVLAGWQGFGRDQRGIPVWLRGNFHFDGTSEDGHFLRLECGLAIPENKDNTKPTWFSGLGFGRRTMITDKMSLDITLSVQSASLWTGRVYDDYTKEYITGDRVRNARSQISSVELSVGLNF